MGARSAPRGGGGRGRERDPALPQLCRLTQPEISGQRRRAVSSVTLAWH